MKSIKEKADEYAKEYLFSLLPQRAPNVHFEAGANYVLEEIEKIVKYDKDPHCIEFLKEVIWRLKKINNYDARR